VTSNEVKREVAVLDPRQSVEVRQYTSTVEDGYYETDYREVSFKIIFRSKVFWFHVIREQDVNFRHDDWQDDNPDGECTDMPDYNDTPVYRMWLLSSANKLEANSWYVEQVTVPRGQS